MQYSTSHVAILWLCSCPKWQSQSMKLPNISWGVFSQTLLVLHAYVCIHAHSDTHVTLILKILATGGIQG